MIENPCYENSIENIEECLHKMWILRDLENIS